MLINEKLILAIKPLSDQPLKDSHGESTLLSFLTLTVSFLDDFFRLVYPVRNCSIQSFKEQFLTILTELSRAVQTTEISAIKKLVKLNDETLTTFLALNFNAYPEIFNFCMVLHLGQ